VALSGNTRRAVWIGPLLRLTPFNFAPHATA